MRIYALLTYIGLFGLVDSCFGQFSSYYSFPNTNARWNVSYTNNVLKSSYYNYYVSGDTVLSSKTYFKLRKSGGYTKNPNVWQSYDTLYCLLREDTTAKKVYASFRPNLGVIDTLLYDFNLNIGDTLPVSYITNSMYPKSYIVSIDSMLIGRHYRKLFVLKNTQFPWWQDSIIEGIGSANGLLELIPWEFETHSELLCFKERDTTVYPFLNDSCEIFVLGTPTVNQKKDIVNIYPNPSNGVFSVQIANSQQLMANSQIEIYNTMGQKVYTQQFSTSNPQLSIDISNQPAGVYMYRVITATGSLVGEGKLIIQK